MKVRCHYTTLYLISMSMFRNKIEGLKICNEHEELKL